MQGPQGNAAATLVGMLLCAASGSFFTTTYAQVVTTNIAPDGTLGTVVASPIPEGLGERYDISGGTIIGGVNQFHSFDLFSVGTLDIANFTGPPGIQNILSRVSGGTASEIDGTLRSSIAGANLFLMNPSGIVFGPNGQIGRAHV